MVDKQSVLKNTVRIRSNERIIGSGMLYVPKEGEKAYVLTVAHVFDNIIDFPVQIECCSDNEIINIEKEQVHLHERYNIEKKL